MHYYHRHTLVRKIHQKSIKLIFSARALWSDEDKSDDSARFFVFLGIIATISSISLLLLGIVLTLLLLLVRFGAVWLTTIGSELKKERSIMSFVLTRGLAAAVLATLPIRYGLLYPDVFINLAVVIIMSTAIIATVGIVIISRTPHS